MNDKVQVAVFREQAEVEEQTTSNFLRNQREMRADKILDANKAVEDEARTLAKELLTHLLQQKFDEKECNRIMLRLKSLSYGRAKVETCILSRLAMRVALGMEPATEDFRKWLSALENFGISSYAVMQAVADAHELRRKHGNDEKKLTDAVYKIFFPKGNLPRR